MERTEHRTIYLIKPIVSEAATTTQSGTLSDPSRLKIAVRKINIRRFVLNSSHRSSGGFYCWQPPQQSIRGLRRRPARPAAGRRHAVECSRLRCVEDPHNTAGARAMAGKQVLLVGGGNAVHVLAAKVGLLQPARPADILSTFGDEVGPRQRPARWALRQGPLERGGRPGGALGR